MAARVNKKYIKIFYEARPPRPGIEGIDVAQGAEKYRIVPGKRGHRSEIAIKIAANKIDNIVMRAI